MLLRAGDVPSFFARTVIVVIHDGAEGVEFSEYQASKVEGGR